MLKFSFSFLYFFKYAPFYLGQLDIFIFSYAPPNFTDTKAIFTYYVFGGVTFFAL